MASTADPKVYLRTRVLTASREELRLLLLDGAVKFLRQAKEGIERSDFECWHVGLTKCRNILIELLTSMKSDVNPELHAKMAGVYTFMYRYLIEADSERNPAKAGKVIDLLEYERETWSLLMKQLVEDRTTLEADEGSIADVAAETAAASSVQAVPNYRPLSVRA